MFALRPAVKEDATYLTKFASQMSFINLPKNKFEIEQKIENSVRSFASPKDELEENNYIFILDDLEKNQVIGCSMIHGKHGTQTHPHLFLRIGQEQFYSQTLKKEMAHRILCFGTQTNGYSEIGGLYLDSSYRGHPQKLGKQLSYVRFLYMALHREYFTRIIHVELMPPLDPKGISPLWPSLGEKFIGMSYKDADVLSRKNKEFIISLFPSQAIYETFLSQEARNIIGKVGKETLPVKKMLEKIGFVYTNEIDPLDGGPHYRARLENITLIQKCTKLNLVTDSSQQGQTYMAMALEEPYLMTFVTKGRIEGEHFIANSQIKEIIKEQPIAVIPF